MQKFLLILIKKILMKKNSEEENFDRKNSNEKF